MGPSLSITGWDQSSRQMSLYKLSPLVVSLSVPRSDSLSLSLDSYLTWLRSQVEFPVSYKLSK